MNENAAEMIRGVFSSVHLSDLYYRVVTQARSGSFPRARQYKSRKFSQQNEKNSYSGLTEILIGSNILPGKINGGDYG